MKVGADPNLGLAPINSYMVSLQTFDHPTSILIYISVTAMELSKQASALKGLLLSIFRALMTANSI